MEPKVRNGKLVQKLITAAVAAIVGIATVLTIISGFEITNTYNTLVEEELRTAVNQLASEMDNVWDGDWSYVDGALYKGEENVMVEYEEIMDELKSKTGVEYSLFYGPTRTITTMKDSSGKKAVGHQISDKVKNAVIDNGQLLFMKGKPAGAAENYFCYYAPMKNSDGSVVGLWTKIPLKGDKLFIC